MVLRAPALLSCWIGAPTAANNPTSDDLSSPPTFAFASESAVIYEALFVRNEAQAVIRPANLDGRLSVLKRLSGLSADQQQGGETGHYGNSDIWQP